MDGIARSVQGGIDMKYKNVVVQVSNYATERLQKTLTEYGEMGFQLVNVTMAKNKYNVEVMYLFFAKERR